ncbi:hypothetical protein FRIGORI9N_40075 [Frigoribacterium sp. 9N]|nr:hypothetical protein FRIGORI9N_40075 [Frigoribacterium sp. 9N]
MQARQAALCGFLRERMTDYEGLRGVDACVEKQWAKRQCHG